MGKLLPTPYPGQSMDEYREQLVNFQKNYWSFLKPSKGGSKFIPSPPLTLIKKTKKMSRKLSEHVEDELFNKEKRVIPSISPDKRVKLHEGVEPKKVIKTKPKLVKESVLGQKNVPPPQQEPRMIKEGEQPAKKKKPYYRKKYNKPKVEVVIPEPVNNHSFNKGLIVGLVIATSIGLIIFLLN